MATKKKVSGLFKTDVVRRVAVEQRLSQRVVNDVLTSTHRLIEETLREGRTVTFPGFGVFKTSKLKAGKFKLFGKALIDRPERRLPHFRAGEILKRAVRGENRLGKGPGVKGGKKK